LYERSVSTFGSNNVTPTLSSWSAGYIAAFAEGIAHSLVPGEQLDACIDSLSESLQSLHAQQLLLSTLLCRSIFASPEPMLHAMHLNYMMHSYNSILGTKSTTSLSKAQHHVKVIAKSIFKNPDFQKLEISRRTTEFDATWMQAYDHINDPIPDMEVECAGIVRTFNADRPGLAKNRKICIN